MHHKQNGFSLTEMLLSIVISSIILGAAFGSYSIINRNFEYQNDMRHISQTARMVVEMINNDVRMAGYKDPLAASISTADAISITECPGGATCDTANGSLDRIKITYDKSNTVRHRITYYATVYPTGSASTDRYRLMKKVEVCNPTANSCTTNAHFTQPGGYDEPVADYIEELSFSGSRGSCKSGEVRFGCGSKEFTTPIASEFVNMGGINSNCPDDALASFDNDNSTFYECSVSSHQYDAAHNSSYIKLTFPSIFRLIRVEIGGGLGSRDGGSFDVSQSEEKGNCGWPWGSCWVGAVAPFGVTTGINPKVRLVRGGNDPHVDGGWTCTWSDEALCTHGLNGAITHHLKYSDYIQWNPVSGKIIDITAGTEDIYITASKYLTVHVLDEGQNCVYENSSPHWNNGMIVNKCNILNGPATQHLRLPDMKFYGEILDGSIIPSEVKTVILIRSPNEHGNVDRANNWNAKTDRYLRDSYIGSVLVRNIHYQSQ